MNLQPPRHIVAFGGSGISSWVPAPALFEHVLGLANKPKPRVCCIPTAVGDSETARKAFFENLPNRARGSELCLFSRTIRDLRGFLLDQDVIYVGGGNTANMLAVWRVHGVDLILREAWEAGIVLSGVSAGGICWFEAGVTDSFGPGLAPLRGALGFLSGSFCPHYDGEVERRPTYHRLVGGGFPPGFAADDGVGLHFVGTDVVEAISVSPNASAYRVEPRDGEAVDLPLATRVLE